MAAVTFEADGLYLALDTSGPVGYVAVSRGGDVLGRARLEMRGRHASKLLPAIHGILEEASATMADIGGVVVGEGPGSFTGVRVAAATAKGLARARGVPLWAVSSLVAAAVPDLGEGGSGVRYVLFDARGDRVYAACYSLGPRGVETLVPPHAGDVGSVLAHDVPPGAVFVGDGAERHRATLEGAGFPVALDPDLGRPTADGLVRYLSHHPNTPPVESPSTWEPRYLKASSAEREWIA